MTNAFALFFGLVDIGYFPFSLKRSTADFLKILTMGGDTVDLAPTFARDYWRLVLFYVAGSRCLLGLTTASVSCNIGHLRNVLGK